MNNRYRCNFSVFFSSLLLMFLIEFVIRKMYNLNLTWQNSQNRTKLQIMFELSEKQQYEFNIIMFLLCVEQGRDTTANQMGM